MLELRSVTVKVSEEIYGVVDVTMSINNDMAVVLGPNGSGKTTLLRAISGIMPYEGSIKVDGIEVRDAVGLLQLSSNLPEIYHVAYDVSGALEILGEFKGIDRGEFMDILRRFNIDPKDVLNKPIHGLSAGQSSIVRFALALSSKPRIILLDEPFESVDPARRSIMLNLITEYGKEGVLVTHELDAVRKFGDNPCYLMIEGRLYGPLSVGQLMNSSIVEGKAANALLTLNIAGSEYSLVEGGAGVRFDVLGSLNRLYGVLT
ncbi:ATP-binding cassette domain-containing protein [Vulcanisaeta thermophila]|uniref:ATP-binding cassette domain-containing protein n=1 Tax=Vulcanisaeta thermophila TaxID=867917 RepID=UPI000853060F|nr:ATP-binding cassette domain-containing protein [Vulcanisaeta thermophila]